MLVRVSACGVCRTDLHIVEGELSPMRPSIVPGHQVVGRVERAGPNAHRFRPGDRVGVAWLRATCGACESCRAGRENLCERAEFTGYHADGGFADYAIVDERFAYAIPSVFGDAEAAPLLCAGAIGHRALRLTGLADGGALGLMGFGASAHLVLQLARHVHPRSKIAVFAREPQARAFALSLGADWAGASDARPPFPLTAIIDTTPAWKPVVDALARLAPGGRLVINAIRKEDADKPALLGLSYHDHLWMEREVKTVANLTGRDIEEFLAIAAAIPIRPVVTTYPLADANRALRELRAGGGTGAKVLIP